MKIILNGKETEILAQNAADLIKSLNLNSKTVIVEYNGKILSAGENQKLKDGDRLEMVSFIGGG